MLTKQASRALARKPLPQISKGMASVAEQDLRGWVERLAVPRHFELEQEENKNTALWIAAQLQGWRCQVEGPFRTRDSRVRPLRQRRRLPRSR